jgi:hypothetical protein
MKDFSLPYLNVKNLLQAYYNAMIAQDKENAVKFANELVENALRLEDIAHDTDRTYTS